MTERIPGTFWKSTQFLHCHKCGKRTMWRRYTHGFYTPLRGERTPKIVSIPYCKSHDEPKKVKKGARK